MEILLPIFAYSVLSALAVYYIVRAAKRRPCRNCGAPTNPLLPSSGLCPGCERANAILNGPRDWPESPLEAAENLRKKGGEKCVFLEMEPGRFHLIFSNNKNTSCKTQSKN